ncbi:hypothetical protein DPMN_051001, partial [Dreissena polymorpha]
MENWKTAPWQPCFQTNRNYFSNLVETSRKNVMTKFHEDWTIKLIFKLDVDIIGTKLWTNFYEDQTVNVAYRVLTRRNVGNPSRMMENGQKLLCSSDQLKEIFDIE